MKTSAQAVSKPEPQAISDCKHCGTPFQPVGDEAEFCCKGCRYVYNLIQGQGLDKYYRLRDGGSAPVESRPFHPRDYAWLDALFQKAEEAGGEISELTLDLQGISCVGCVWLIEELFRRREGALKIQVNAQLGQMRLRWAAGAFDLPGFARELQRFGYLAGPPGKKKYAESRQIVTLLGLCGAFALNAMLFALPSYLGMSADSEWAGLFRLLTMLFATLSLATGGSYFISRAFHSLRRGVLHIDLPIALGILAAYGGSLAGWFLGREALIYFDFVAVFIFLMLAGRWLQENAVEKNRQYLLEKDARPQEVPVYAGDNPNPTRIPVAGLAAGQTFGVGPGQVVPVCGRLVSAAASLSLEWINGESEPQSWKTGCLLPSGAANIGRSEIRLQAAETWDESLLARLLKASAKDTYRHRSLERILKIYIGAVLATGFLGGGAWLIWNGSIVASLQVLISVLVVSCPCALGVAVPLANEMAVAALRKSGVFIRSENLWPRLAGIRKIIFDKTGTLTLETPLLKNPQALKTLSAEQQQALFQLADTNLHPVSRCLRENLLTLSGLRHEAPEISIKETVGFGLTGSTKTGTWFLGRPNRQEIDAGTAPAHDCEFRLNDRILAQFRFEEGVRQDAAEEVAALQAGGYEVYILSGDRKSKVAPMADALGIPAEHALGELSPQEKADWVSRTGRKDTLMIGDGANDSLAFDAAACRGTPVIDRGLLEHKADFYFLGGGLSGIRRLLKTGRRRQKGIREVFTLAVVYNVIAVAICLAGRMNPLLAAVLMPLSSLATMGIVIFRLGRGTPE